ncbi:IS4 family transposase [Paraburkholderia sp. BL10I2N1]|uniref:IS4 family transposase n=1 Tax=Paraburkholderia sp. BL10I2N1 TaxID=1938796 RepID=UPI00105B779B|nr:IS4 family transposase [Paraburkholderia sp. BL10I2N1]TDN57722.1 transposase Tn5 family protein [Paraburkholderia sp. BL10I2N1]TDN59335.1 transposase Tn5 family protein [Paraburkholderia sp. BL10I2N1]TDN69516.1 transposase Tn5 family protein [Paraburkholderia sp. BL10I2N1]TDN69867.1 transposase Tn5 family protein [Paraburkholderia sp. BL10I2N1]TDN69974.1 transposase Tn5 family protein [Paraburkholderia sp. BL10I2N1]
MPSIDDNADWADTEFGAANLGDARLTSRLVALARRLASSPDCPFPRSLNAAELKAAYRFFDNEQVDTDGVLAPHIEQTLRRMTRIPVVLAVQDTTEFNLSHLKATEGLGYGTGNASRGFMLHSLLAVTPEGLPLGVLGMKTWVRPDAQLGKKQQRKHLPVADKESVKWLEGIAHLGALKARCPETLVIGIGDRESDLYEVFTAERPRGVEWLIRAKSDRKTVNPEHSLWEAVAATAPLGETELQVPPVGNQPRRVARLTLRCTPVRLRPPQRPSSRLAEVTVYAIHALETTPPADIEPLEWMLLSSVPTITFEDTLERLGWYARRWTIESWHRVLKSGCSIEKRQFGNLERFVRSTALFAVISWRIMYATLLGRADPDLSCEVLLQPDEWRALHSRTHRTSKPPTAIPSLGEVVLWIAKLGGYLNRKHDHPPGPTVMWRGFLVLHEITEMYRIFRQDE